MLYKAIDSNSKLTLTVFSLHYVVSQYAVTWREENALIIEWKKNELFGGKLRRQEWTSNEEIEIDMSKIVGRKDRKYDINWRKEEKNEIRMEQKEENWRKKKLNHKKCVKVPQK